MKLVNDIVSNLAPYPMEELARIRAGLVKEGKKVFDFGTGDPRIPTWAPIREALLNAIPAISQYPSVKGSPGLRQAQLGYLHRRFGITESPAIDLLPTHGSKEAVFNVALCLIGRAGKRHLIYPDPGYPVYRSSALFAGGVPYPVEVKGDFLLKPWELPADIQKSAAAIWINHPHNPSGAMAPYSYWQDVIAWCHKTDTILLSDDCYVDIYDAALDQHASTDPTKDSRPLCPLQLSTDRIISFMSLSKRSGITGYRSGMIVGDARIIKPLATARANFGVGSQDFVQAAATVAWADDDHVEERRRIFTRRMHQVEPVLKELGLIDSLPAAAFYLWCRVPPKFGDDDVAFVMKLATHGIIASPSQWLSEGIRGYFRLALVPTEADIAEALDILKAFIKG
jgi:succinyldiaminopimelate transaminase